MEKKKKREKTGGRQTGTPNKINATVKMMVLGALDKLGGEKWLQKLAADHPQAFAQLLAKIMPTQVVGDVTRPFVALIPAPSGSSEEWLKTYAHLASQNSAPSATKH